MLYDFWYKILSDESKDKLFRSVLVYDGFSLVDKTGQNIGLQLMTKITGYAGVLRTSRLKWYPSKGYSKHHATGSVTHFDAAKLLKTMVTLSTHEMTHNSDGGILLWGQWPP